MSLGAVCGLITGFAFLWAAMAKLAVKGWAEHTSQALGVPFTAARVTPVTELVVGAACVTRLPGAGVAATVLLLAYTAVLAPRVGGPPCACFGRDAKPITWRTIGRNVVLIACAIGSVVG